MKSRIDKLLFNIFGYEYYCKVHGEIFNKFQDILNQCGMELLLYTNLSHFGHLVLYKLFGSSYLGSLQEYYHIDFKSKTKLKDEDMIERWQGLPLSEFYECIEK